MSGPLINGVASHLLHPTLGWMPGNAGQAYPPGLKMKEKQDVVRGQASPGEQFDREEVDSSKNRHMRRDEVLPVCVLAALRCGGYAVTAKDVANRLILNNHRLKAVGLGGD